MWTGSVWADTPVYDRERLGPGHELAGPAIIVQMDSTVVVPPGWAARVTPREALLLDHVGI
jgi:N-methylhydantoinase A/oxoprolinase/acetone carboxylase beta subunit